MKEPMVSAPDSDDSRIGASSTSRPAEHPGMPKWVKALIGLVVAIFVVLLIVKAASGGGHGPGRHTGLGDPAAVAALTSAG